MDQIGKYNHKYTYKYNQIDIHHILYNVQYII